MIYEVYDAFLAAGAPEDKARKAAEAIASYENRFARIEESARRLARSVGASPTQLPGGECCASRR